MSYDASEHADDIAGAACCDRGLVEEDRSGSHAVTARPSVHFGSFEVDPERFELRRSGQPVRVEPQVFEVLAYLARNRDRVVRKNELLDEIWGDRFVSDSALTSRIKSARRAVGDTGRDQRVIRTVHGRGYRFVAGVEEVHA